MNGGYYIITPITFVVVAFDVLAGAQVHASSVVARNHIMRENDSPAARAGTSQPLQRCDVLQRIPVRRHVRHT